MWRLLVPGLEVKALVPPVISETRNSVDLVDLVLVVLVVLVEVVAMFD